MESKELIRIVIIGPESTGKSVLSEQLAQHYGTRWCPEYARAYLLQHGKDYTYDDLLTIAKGQVAAEDACAAEQLISQPFNPLLFIDTDLYVMKVWSEFVFDRCDRYILDGIVERQYDLYLLCKPDLPWVQDELREYPDLESRELLYRIYLDLLINQSVPWTEISGSYAERLPMAVKAVDELLKKLGEETRVD